MAVSAGLREYVEGNVFPEYAKNDEAHRLEHITAVLDRCGELRGELGLSLDDDMVFAVAAYHDVGHHIDAANHEAVSAEIFFNDIKTREFFTDEQRAIIRDAIYDHRASSDTEPRTDYGRLISTADRSSNINDCVYRTYQYSLHHFPQLTYEEHKSRVYSHLVGKYGDGGYAKVPLPNSAHDRFKAEIDHFATNPEAFSAMFDQLIGKA